MEKANYILTERTPKGQRWNNKINNTDINKWLKNIHKWGKTSNSAILRVLNNLCTCFPLMEHDPHTYDL